MNKLTVLILLLISRPAIGQREHKFYITGYAAGGDCDHPPIIAYGKDRLDALHKAGISISRSGVTVWTSAEYTKMRKDIGKQFDEGCAERKTAPIVPPPDTALSNPGYMVCPAGDYCEFDQLGPSPDDHTKEIQSPKAVDVPPITEEYGNPGYEVCDMGNCVWTEAPEGKRRTRSTCADKTRFLMTSEDGKKHCIKLGD